MILETQIGITLAAGAGNGVTSNKQVSTTRKNTFKVIFGCPAGNTGRIRVGQSSLTVADPTPTFVAPTDPLTDATSIAIIQPNGTATFEVPSWQVERGDRYDLQRFWVQGDNAGDIVIIRYQVRVDA